MSKMGNWVFEMQEDANQMTLSQFTEKHGFSSSEVWYEYNISVETDSEPDYELLEIDDGA